MRKIRTLLLVAAGLGAFWLVAGGAHTLAATYDVNAFVPYPTPTVAATIDTPTNGASFTNAQQTVSGTCQVATPSLIISLWRNGQALGSTTCSSGAYTLAITLQIGQNSISARTANLNGVYGPDSTLAMFTLTQPTPVEPLPPTVTQPTNPTQTVTATNQGAAADLQVTTQQPFSVLNTDNSVSITVNVQGGKNPYVLQLTWGDGSIESHSIDTPGTYEFTHTYQKQRQYAVRVSVRDLLGAYTEYTYAVVTPAKQNSSKPTTASGGTSQTGRAVSGRVYMWLFLFLIAFFLATSYAFGWYRAKRKYEQKPKQRTRVVAKKRKRKGQK